MSEKVEIVQQLKELVHDLNGPLTAAKCETEWLQSELSKKPVDEQLQRQVQKGLEEINDAILLVQNMLSAFAQAGGERGDFSKLSIAIIKGLNPRLRHWCGRIDYEVEENCVSEFNLADYCRILSNLLLNTEHAFLKSELELDERELKMQLKKLGTEGFSLTVKDNGNGVQKENLEKIFKSGFSTGGEGHQGLGLGACMRLSEKNGASLSCESLPGKGCAFQLLYTHKQGEQ